MRAQDIGIGLAVEWARRRGINAGVMVCGDGTKARVWGNCSVMLGGMPVHAVRHYDRGPVVAPEPWHDHRVAFGIAMARRGPWRRCPHRAASQPVCWLPVRPRDTFCHVVDAGDHVLVDGPLTIGHKYIDLALVGIGLCFDRNHKPARRRAQ